MFEEANNVDKTDNRTLITWQRKARRAKMYAWDLFSGVG